MVVELATQANKCTQSALCLHFHGFHMYKTEPGCRDNNSFLHSFASRALHVFWAQGIPTSNSALKLIWPWPWITFYSMLKIPLSPIPGSFRGSDKLIIVFFFFWWKKVCKDCTCMCQTKLNLHCSCCTNLILIRCSFRPIWQLSWFLDHSHFCKHFPWTIVACGFLKVILTRVFTVLFYVTKCWGGILTC